MAAGIAPAIDRIVPDRDELDPYRERLGDPLLLVVLDPGADVRGVGRSDPCRGDRRSRLG